jgi:hypothetical protein
LVFLFAVVFDPFFHVGDISHFFDTTGPVAGDDDIVLRQIERVITDSMPATFSLVRQAC